MFHSLVALWFRLSLQWGYGGVFTCMAIESTVFPLPSEVVIPPAAYWAAQGHMHFWGVVAAATLGSWAGSALSYAVARAVGRPLLLRYGRYVLLTERKWLLAEGWINRYSAAGIFFARLLPVVRHLVSLPAGAARMRFGLFTGTTLAGSLLWSTVLAWFGARVLADEPRLMQDPDALARVLKHKLVWFVVAALVMLLAYVLVDVLGRRLRRDTGSAPPASCAGAGGPRGPRGRAGSRSRSDRSEEGTMPTVELVDVSKVYGRDHRAVAGVSLSIHDGEFLVLVGPSGCGKSTLLRMVAGLEEVSAGRIEIGGRVVNDVAPKDRDIAMVFQNYALYPHMSVYDNMAFGLRRRRLPETEVDRKVRAAADTLGLEAYLTRRPRELSGGERQRVALGRAMVREPQVFLFDEPLSNLDAKLRVQMRAEIKRLHQRVRATMIYVTHDQVEAMTLGDRIAVLDRGVLQQVADPFTLYRSPANQFVAGFIGSPPINFFTATLDAAGTRLELGDAGVPLPADLSAALQSRRGRAVTLGIRPEDVLLEERGPGMTIPGVVDVREPLGNEVLVHLATPVGTLVSRYPGQAVPEVGAKARLHLAFDRLYGFDPDTRVCLRGAA